MAGHAAHYERGNERALVISAVLTGVYFVIEFVAALLIGSVAVLSDAFHTFSAVGGVVIAIAAGRYAMRPASATHTFGYFRAEISGAFVNGLFLLGMAVFVMVMGVMRLGAPMELATTPMLLVAGGGLLTEIYALALLFRRQKQDVNVRGAYWHVVQTFIGSLIIIVAAIVIRTTGFLLIDPILGIAFGVVLAAASVQILRQAIEIFMEGTPRDLDLLVVHDDIKGLDGVLDVHHMHAWTLSSGRIVFSAHAVTDGRPAEPMLRAIEALLRNDHGIYFSTVQMETEREDDRAAAIDFLAAEPQARGERLSSDDPHESPDPHAHHQA